MRILIVTIAVPYPTISGGKLRVYNLVKRISRTHEVWLACFAFSDEEEEGVSEMEKYCRGVTVRKWYKKDRPQKLIKAIQFTLKGIPFEYCYLDSEDFTQDLHSLIERFDFDIVHIVPSSMGLFLDTLNLPPSCHSILGWYDINSSQYNTILKIQKSLYWRIRNWLYAKTLYRWEQTITNRFDRCEVVSELDKKLLQAVNPGLKINVIPNGVDTRLLHPKEREDNGKTLLFIGNMSYYPCTDAMEYFCGEIFPLIQNALPETRLLIVGVDPPIQIQRLESDAIHVTGKVNDILPYYQQSTISIVPLRAGGGTRLKILEAMAIGCPVVSTSKGCEGLEVIPDKHLLVADTPKQFASKTVALLTDSDLYKKLSLSARRLVTQIYDWDLIAQDLMNVYAEMGRT